MKMVKKTLVLLLAVLLLVTVVPMVVSAEGIEDNLIIHYDFEGDTAADMLKDKATALGDNKPLVMTGGAENGITFENGKATIPATANSHLTLDKSVDLTNRQQSITVFARFSAEYENASGQENTAFWVRNIGYVTLGDPTEDHSTVTMNYNTAKNGVQSHLLGHENPIYHNADMCNVAFTISYEGTSLTLKTYLMYDRDIDNAVVKTQTLADADYLSATSKMICIGNDNSPTNTNKYSYTFDDVRVYNTVLTETDIKGIAAKLYEADKAAGNTRFAGWQSTEFVGGYCDLRILGILKDSDSDGSLSDEYQAVGFEIKMIVIPKDAVDPTKADGKKWTNIDTTTGKAPQITKVYTSVYGRDSDTGEPVQYTATQLGGDYFFAATVKGVKQNVGEVTFVVRTFYDNLEGERVYNDVTVFIFDTGTAEEA